MKFGGFLLLAAALVFAVRAYHPSSFDQKSPQEAAAPERAASIAASVAPRSDSAVAANESSSVTLKSLPARAAAREALKASVVAADSQPTDDTAVVVSLAVAMPLAAAVPSEPAAPVVEAKPERTASSLVRNLKRELRRVGCYDGGIDSDWDRPSRSAMGRFLDRVNAALPVEKPDHAMLALVRGQRAAVCGQACPSGQAMGDAGRCMPLAIIAKEARKRAPLVAAAETPVVSTPFTTTVTVGEVRPSAARQPAPAAQVRGTAVVAQAEPVARPAPLPGRMAMGGPVTARAVPEERSWWQTLLTGPDEPARATAAAPVKTAARHVPEPKIVRNSDVQLGSAPSQALGAQATNGASDGTALQTAAIASPDAIAAAELTEQPIAKKPKASGRKAAKPRSSRTRTASRKWRGRNVQAMFQHPLGRM